jgi:hypothetical protein
MNMASITVKVELTEINCGKCGGTYAINERYREQQYKNGGSWTCPYCACGWGYSQNNEVSKLKAKLQKEERRRLWAEENASQARKDAKESEQRRRAQKAATTRLKNRVKAGVCPCCHRTFKQLQAHMKNKHPDYAADNTELPSKQ